MFFDTANEAADTSLPDGSYRFVVMHGTVKPTKAGTGRYCEATLEVVEGDYKGDQVTARFNVENPNAVAVRIGKAELKRFLTACGVTEALKTAEDFGRAVQGRVLWGEVSRRKDKNSPKEFVEVGGFNADVPGAPPPSHQPARTAEDSRIPF